MKVAISATNPCHLYDLARELHRRGALGAYFSGYPGWRLRPPAGFPLRAHSLRTVVTYGLLRCPAVFRPRPPTLFRWQDAGFDRAVARDIGPADGELIHAMPGQALHTFRAAKSAGLETCLNHASGPVRQQLAIQARVWKQTGLVETAQHRFDANYFAREDEEYSLADWHCVASSVVRRQLIEEGVAPQRIWVAPYGADPAVFHLPAAGAPPRSSRIVFAGQLTLRKGLDTLFAAMQLLPTTVTLDCYGRVAPDIRTALARVAGDARIRLRGPVSQSILAEALRTSRALVLPSWEEAFGLVVPQALNCGTPCIVSDRVGAQDIIRHRTNGSVFPPGDVTALATELAWWLDHPMAFSDNPHTWQEPAELLLDRMTRRHTPAP